MRSLGSTQLPYTYSIGQFPTQILTKIIPQYSFDENIYSIHRYHNIILNLVKIVVFIANKLFVVEVSRSHLCSQVKISQTQFSKVIGVTFMIKGVLENAHGKLSDQSINNVVMKNSGGMTVMKNMKDISQNYKLLPKPCDPEHAPSGA